ncbi:IS4 family transposase [Verrucosispora sp. NA02020]|uniref:IS4 family transposase n=1 Tax=Verrucosispora sp. NA02020 TaxID=2742132 RepID=UPI001592562C|nr:IS4 family transposase [Verrucosispora sp. NA02020]QKW11463.1 IS4 family transposase [Verrucosispora sp. NA02020]QKW11587.1 IS4 family transposase [Verrucosispora sp. NA02020]QKW12534.1 IS4 family transposase [Verrucosispora sp. NA02020]QKW12535.1 IS4 family transposase [Verrucosispora sp. NA02020]QKW12708.1 IS4 family transposase [Verrucosispora sp. NA02020]
MEQSAITSTIRVAAGRFAPGHLGELTQQVPFEMVDAVLAEAGGVQSRVRDLPSRVVVYLLLAAGLFAEVGYRQVWARLVAGLDGLTVALPTSSALSQARRRVGDKPLVALFRLLSGPPAGAARWRGLLVCAIDGTSMFVPDTAANLTVYPRQAGSHGGSGYPMLRLVAVVACGTRAVIDAVFTPISTGELTCAGRLLGCLRPGMLLLADRGFAARQMIEQFASTGADLLIRDKDDRRLPVIRRHRDGSWLSVIGTMTVRVVDAEIVVSMNGKRHVGRYRLITTLTDQRRFPAMDLVTLYHHRWEIETTYLELKSTLRGGRVLRARTPNGISQEVHALLTTYQAVRLAMADATASRPTTNPDRASFTIAVHAARDQITQAAGVIAGTVIDLVGTIGRAILADLLPPRRTRISPRVVKRAISKHRAKGTIDRTNYHATININILETAALTTRPPP